MHDHVQQTWCEGPFRPPLYFTELSRRVWACATLWAALQLARYLMNNDVAGVFRQRGSAIAQRVRW